MDDSHGGLAAPKVQPTIARTMPPTATKTIARRNKGSRGIERFKEVLFKSHGGVQRFHHMVERSAVLQEGLIPLGTVPPEFQPVAEVPPPPPPRAPREGGEGNNNDDDAPIVAPAQDETVPTKTNAPIVREASEIDEALLKRKLRTLVGLYYEWNHTTFLKCPMRDSLPLLHKASNKVGFENLSAFELNQRMLNRQRLGIEGGGEAILPQEGTDIYTTRYARKVGAIAPGGGGRKKGAKKRQHEGLREEEEEELHPIPPPPGGAADHHHHPTPDEAFETEMNRASAVANDLQYLVGDDDEFDEDLMRDAIGADEEIADSDADPFRHPAELGFFANPPAASAVASSDPSTSLDTQAMERAALVPTADQAASPPSNDDHSIANDGAPGHSADSSNNKAIQQTLLIDEEEEASASAVAAAADSSSLVPSGAELQHAIDTQQQQEEPQQGEEGGFDETFVGDEE